MENFGCLKIIIEFFYVSSPLQWNKKFRTYNIGPLWQTWASSVSKFTVDEMKNEKWGFKVLGLGKWGSLAA